MTSAEKIYMLMHGPRFARGEKEVFLKYRERHPEAEYEMHWTQFASEAKQFVTEKEAWFYAYDMLGMHSAKLDIWVVEARPQAIRWSRPPKEKA